MRGPTASHSVTNRSSFSIACAKQALAFELNLASCHIYALNLSDSPACPQERSQPGCACGALHAGSCRHSWKQSRGERTVAQSTPLCPWPAASAPGRRGAFVCRIHVVCYLHICQIITCFTSCSTLVRRCLPTWDRSKRHTPASHCCARLPKQRCCLRRPVELPTACMRIISNNYMFQ